MYSYITELSPKRKFSQSYEFSSEYHRQRKSQSRDISIRYECPSIKHVTSHTIGIQIDKFFKRNEAANYISLNKYNIKPKPMNRLRIRTCIVIKPKSINKPKTHTLVVNYQKS